MTATRPTLAVNNTDAPQHSPWGPIQRLKEVASGIWHISTASHGGFYLAPERQLSVTPCLRDPSRFYEEDLQWCVVAICFPHVFALDDVKDAWRRLREFFPDDYEEFTGEILQPGESMHRDQKVWWQTHANSLVATCAYSDNFAWVPAGMIGLIANVGEPGSPRAHLVPPRYFLVLRDDYAPSRWGFVVDPAVCQEVAVSRDLLQRRRTDLAA